MALIKYSECGKEFSDKAPACPNCGCPTSEVLKGTISPEEQKKAAEQMLAAVDQVLDRARKAGAWFRFRILLRAKCLAFVLPPHRKLQIV